MIEFSIIWALAPKYWQFGWGVAEIDDIPGVEGYIAKGYTLWLLFVGFQLTTYLNNDH